MEAITITPFTIQNLYRMETYTDQTAGTIFRQIPVTLTGERDPMRQEHFGASTNMMTNRGLVPVNFEIEGASSLEEAIRLYPEAVRAMVTRMQEEALRSKILMPGSSAPSNNRRG